MKLSTCYSRTRKSILKSAAISLTFASVALCQNTPTAVNTHRQKPPQFLLYRHFLAYQNHLDRVADELNKQGKDGSEFRDHFQRSMGFSDAEFAPIRATALRLDTELKEEDAKVRTVIDATRAKYGSHLQNPFSLPPVPPELIDLQKERDALIQHEVDQLKNSLGTTRAAKLDSMIENDFAPSVTVHTVHPSVPAHDPIKNPLPPFPSEVQ